LFFLPYLSGERVGTLTNARAQFFGLSAQHGLPHLHRAVMEGVAFGMRRYLHTLNASGARIERIVAASGGAKSALWLRIKASMYQTPIAVPAESEGGILGCAMLAATACGKVGSVKEAAQRFVHFTQVIEPDAATCDHYARMAEVFDRVYETAQPLYAALDALPDQHAQRQGVPA
jgi:xylulokinase